MTGMKKKQRKRLKLYDEQDGCCYWCGVETFLPDPEIRWAKNMATIDHLRDRTDKMRSERTSGHERRQVLSCSRCNWIRNKCILQSHRRFLTEHRFSPMSAR